MLVNVLLLEPVNLLNHRSNINSIVTVVNLVVVCSAWVDQQLWHTLLALPGMTNSCPSQILGSGISYKNDIEVPKPDTEPSFPNVNKAHIQIIQKHISHTLPLSSRYLNFSVKHNNNNKR